MSAGLRWPPSKQGPQVPRDYTVAVGTGAGTRYLAVPVARGPGGLPVLAGYPALVASPAVDRAGALGDAGLPAVTDSAAAAVLRRALRNDLAGSYDNLAADLAPHARIESAAPGLSPLGVVRLAIEPSGAVLATARAADSQGDVFTLGYELTVAELDGRWEITRIGYDDR